MAVTLKLVGLAELERKLQHSVLVEPGLRDAVETIVDRIKRQGRGRGARNNVLTPTLYDMGATSRDLVATVDSTLRQPRTVGSSWQRKNVGIFKSAAPRIIRKWIGRMESTWGS